MLETDLSAKVRGLEDELKILKAEIRNVLLDIREVVLERTNPLGDGARVPGPPGDESTAAGPGEAAQDAQDMQDAQDIQEAQDMQEAQDAAGQADAVEGELAAGAAPDEAPSAGKEAAPPPEDGVSRGVAMGPAQAVPPYYGLSPLAGNSAGFVAWVAEAVKAIGSQQLDHVVMLYRLGGVVPPQHQQGSRPSPGAPAPIQRTRSPLAQGPPGAGQALVLLRREPWQARAGRPS